MHHLLRFICSVTYKLCHEKMCLKICVVVIPKGPHQSFFGYDTDYKIALFCFQGLYSVVGVILKEGLVGPKPANSSFGMAMTKVLRSVSPWRDSNVLIVLVERSVPDHNYIN